MKVIIPAAGAGTRLRPHTHTTPKALVQVAGKPILGHILDRISTLDVTKLIIIIGYMGDKIKNYLDAHYNFKTTYVEQEKRLGLGYAINLAKDYLDDEPTLITLDDTILEMDMAAMVKGAYSSIGAREVEDASRFGIIELENGFIKRLIEKPENPPSNLAIVGVYYIQNTPQKIMRPFEKQGRKISYFPKGVKMNIPLTIPYLSDEEAELAKEVILSGWVSQGKRVAEFERLVADYVGAKHGVATSSCTSALHLSIIIAGIGEGDEVICPSYTFVATANSIMFVGATPVFVEIDPKTYNIDAVAIESAITDRTKAILVVHQIGLPADMDAIFDIAHKHNLEVIEDAACAIGASYKGKRIGSLSKYSCFSFHPRKVITTGEGGMLTTNDDEVAEQARILRSHGASISDLARHKAGGVIYEEYKVVGYNYRLTDIQAALGIHQMKKLDFILRRRLEVASKYDEMLAVVEEVQTPYVPHDTVHTYQSYQIRLTDKSKVSRDELLKKMVESGISCRRGIPPIHLEPYYRAKFGEIRLPITEEVSRTTLFLPIYPTMTEKEQKYVVDTLKQLLMEK